MSDMIAETKDSLPITVIGSRGGTVPIDTAYNMTFGFNKRDGNPEGLGPMFSTFHGLPNSLACKSVASISSEQPDGSRLIKFPRIEPRESDYIEMADMDRLVPVNVLFDTFTLRDSRPHNTPSLASQTRTTPDQIVVQLPSDNKGQEINLYYQTSREEGSSRYEGIPSDMESYRAKFHVRVHPFRLEGGRTSKVGKEFSDTAESEGAQGGGEEASTDLSDGGACQDKTPISLDISAVTVSHGLMYAERKNGEWSVT